MSSPIIDETVSKYKSALDKLLEEIQQFSQHINNPELEQTLANLRHNIEDESFLRAIESINASIAPRFLGGSAATVAGTLIAAITEVVLLDILGAAFAGVGIVIAGGTIFLKKRKIIQQFEQKLDQEKDKFTTEISDKLNSQLSIIYEEIERNFIDIYDYVEKEEKNIIPLVTEYSQIKEKSTKLFNVIQIDFAEK